MEPMIRERESGVHLGGQGHVEVHVHSHICISILSHPPCQQLGCGRRERENVIAHLCIQCYVIIERPALSSTLGSVYLPVRSASTWLCLIAVRLSLSPEVSRKCSLNCLVSSPPPPPSSLPTIHRMIIVFNSYAFKVTK